MKGSLLKTELRNALDHTNDIVEKSSTSPILKNVFINFTHDKAYITATDTHIEITVEIPASVESEGKTTVNAEELFSIVKNLSEEDLIFELQDNSLEMKTPSSKYSFPTIDPDEFIFMNIEKVKKEMTFMAGHLQYSLKKVIPFAAPNIRVAQQPMYVGVLFERYSDFLLIGATDGASLGYIEFDTDKLEIEERVRFVLPLKCAKAVEKIIAPLEEDEQVFVQLGEDRAVINIGSVSYKILLIAEEYMDLRNLIQQDSKYEIKYNVENLRSRLKPLFAILDPDSACFTIDFDGDEQTKISAYNSPIKSEVIIEVVESNKEKFKIYVDVSNFNKVLSLLDSKNLILKMPAKRNPLFIKPEESPEGCRQFYFFSALTF